MYVCRQVCLDMLELLVDRRSHRRDIRALLVGHGEQQRLCTVHSDILCQVGVFNLHRCYIFQAHSLSAWIRIDHGIFYIVDGVQTLIDMDRTAIEPVAHIAPRTREAFTCQFLRHSNIRDAILRQARGIEVDVDLRVLLSCETHLSYRGYHAERILHDHHIAPQLTVGLVLTLQRDKLRRNVAEVVLHAHGKHAYWKTGTLEGLHTMFELRPELILVLDVLIEFHNDDGHTVARIAHGLLLQHLFIREDVTLQGLRHLLLHFLRGCSRIDRSHDTLAHGVIGELILIDIHQSINAECHKARHQQNDDLPVIQAYLLE